MKKFNDLIEKSDLPVLVDFYADWCQPCVLMVPILRELAEELRGKVKIVKVDIDKNSHAALKYTIRSVPTMILFDHGRILWRNSGVMTKEQLAEALYKSLLLQNVPK